MDWAVYCTELERMSMLEYQSDKVEWDKDITFVYLDI